ncbi:MAG: response regulator transcription factor [Bacteroidia bacterium]|nr:MAG: response regulator transcription factor [Bacteroidia bacterium]
MKVIISDTHFLSRTGLEFILNKHFNEVELLISTIEGYKVLSQQIKHFDPEIVLLDYISTNISSEELLKLMLRYPQVRFILITEWLPKVELMKYFQIGIKWHLLKECDEIEIKECIEYALNNQSFFCNKLIQFIHSQNSEVSKEMRTNADCNGILITNREREIIQLIAEGKSNKEIAEVLNISVHTVLTHRKNIMKKTHANNTAGLVLFALKNNIIIPTNHFLFAENG